jgi:NADPH-dependent F420 reductase
MDEIKKIAVIGGTGREGFGLALRWAKAGKSILIGSRSEEKAQAAAGKINTQLGQTLAVGTSNALAAREGDLVLLSIPYQGHELILPAIRESVQGKIVVEVTVPLDPNDPTQVKMPEIGSVAEETQAFLGSKTPVVGAFHTISSASLKKLDQKPDSDVLVFSDHSQAKETVIQLAELIGFRALDCGPLRTGRTIERLPALLVWLNKRYQKKDISFHFTGL